MSTKLALVSINVVTFNAKPYIQTALKSIKAQTYPHIEVNILDNNSQDGTPEIIDTILNDLKLKAINYKLKANTGFAKGHNILIRKSRGEYVLLLNQDAWLDKEYVSRALEIFGQDDTIAAIQPKIYRYSFAAGAVVARDGKAVIDATGLAILKNRRVIARGQGQTDNGQFDNQEEVFGADGAVPIYRRMALEDVALPLSNPPSRGASADLRTSTNSQTHQGVLKEYFDEDFFMYKEDVDLSWRLRLYGWNILYSPRVIAYHARGSGESASRKYSEIIQERRHISPLAKSLSWRNQRLMQIKDELPGLYVRHFPFILGKELASFLYILFFERYALRSMREFFTLLPNALRKRKIIMQHIAISRKQLTHWFQ